MMNRMLSILSTVLAALLPLPVVADLAGGATAVSQYGKERDEQTLSADLSWTPGQWTVYVEGSTGLSSDSLLAAYPGVNADAATAVNSDGNGRVQVSELKYRFQPGSAALVVGLLDATAYLDTSRVANDETRQFLGADFVNNPSIAFPDYAPGIALLQPVGDAEWRAVLGSSKGLAGTSGTRYSETLEITGRERGMFLATEWRNIAGDTDWSIGAWHNSGDVERPDGQGETNERAGIYGGLDTPVAGGDANLRAGWNNSHGKPVRAFLAAAWTIDWQEWRLGIAHARRFANSATTGNDADHSEIFLQRALASGLHLAIDLQYLSGNSNGPPRPDGAIAGLRLHYGF
ncbi:MAG: hypothetical protein R3270_02760 [Gammaproteobacteria bacterium]|nr:hypothetical protein [Gammaproteobacteria bacterium]